MRFPLRLLFYLLLMIFVLLQAAACVPQPESSLIPTGTETPIPQPSPTALPQTVSIGANPGPVDIPKYIPTPVPENYPAPENYTSIPTIKPTATIILPTETPSLIPDCYVLGGYPTQFGSVVENSNLCELEMTLDSVNGKVGYRLFYPKEWIADAAGVSGYNVMFNRGIETGRNQQVFVLFSTSDLPLDQSDRIGNCSEGGCIPLINPDEIQGKAFQVIKDKPIFKVITRGNGVWTVRYFFKSISYRLFMVEFSTPIADIHSKDYYSLINNVEDMISSMVFIEPK